MFYYFLVELMTYYDTTKFHGHWPSDREITRGRGGIPLPSALPDSEKPGLFRVKGLRCFCNVKDYRGGHFDPLLIQEPKKLEQGNFAQLWPII